MLHMLAEAGLVGAPADGFRCLRRNTSRTMSGLTNAGLVGCAQGKWCGDYLLGWRMKMLTTLEDYRRRTEGGGRGKSPKVAVMCLMECGFVGQPVRMRAVAERAVRSYHRRMAGDHFVVDSVTVTVMVENRHCLDLACRNAPVLVEEVALAGDVHLHKHIVAGSGDHTPVALVVTSTPRGETRNLDAP